MYRPYPYRDINRLQKYWTPAPVPDPDPGFAGVTIFFAVIILYIPPCTTLPVQRRLLLRSPPLTLQV